MKKTTKNKKNKNIFKMKNKYINDIVYLSFKTYSKFKKNK